MTTQSAPTPRRRGRALGFVAGVAFISVLSAGVGAGAATLVTSAQIKNGTIVGIDVKNGGLTGKDLKDGSVTSADVKDGSLTGGDVKDGSLAVDELSTAARAVLVDDTIPSGTTVTGLAYFDAQTNTNGDFGFGVTLPGKAGIQLTDSVVNFRRTGDPAIASNEDPTSACTGSGNAPSAPPGRVCVYLVNASAGTGNLAAGAPFGGTGDQTFAIRWSHDVSDTGDVFVTARWAYTAP